MKTKTITTSQFRTSINRAPLRQGLLVILVCFALFSGAQAVSPSPDGGYPGSKTAEGTNALFSLTTGFWNTALGGQALYFDNTGSSNTAVGVKTLFNNTSGTNNTANGVYALFSNTTGSNSTATGYQALYGNIDGAGNTADGYQALSKNTTSSRSTATARSRPRNAMTLRSIAVAKTPR